MSKFRLYAIVATLRMRLLRRIKTFRTRFGQFQRVPRQDMAQIYRRALQTMDDDQRTVFLLHLREERSIAEIAGHLSLSSAEIEHLLGQAITHITDRLHRSQF